ncbi:hypothetical protein ACFQ10_18010 [Streptomyces indonesiensis]
MLLHFPGASRRLRLPTRPDWTALVIRTGGAVLLLGLDPLPQTADAAQVDNAWGGVSTSDKPKEVARFNRRFNQMIASALPSEETPEFMQRLAREL